MKKLKKGDQVVVLSGKDKGRTGAITRVFEDTILVEGVNVSKKHQRGNPQKNQPGGLLDKEMPLHISNVALVNPDTKLPARVGFKVETDDRGKTVRTRYFKDSRRADSKKAKALRGDDKPKADEKPKGESKPKTEKVDAPAKAAPKTAAKKDAAKASEKDAE